MRILSGILCLVMVAFAVVQYNDPDGPVWIVAYGVPAVWAGLAAFRPNLLAGGLARGLLGLSLAAALVATFLLWPTTPGWWRQEVWWVDEPAREGMGLMILTVTLVVAAIVAFRRRPARGFARSRHAVRGAL